MGKGRPLTIYHLYDGAEDLGYYHFQGLVEIIGCNPQRLRNSIKMGTRYRDRYKVVKTKYTDMDQIPKNRLKNVKGHYITGSKACERKTSSGHTYKLPIWS